MELNSIVLMVLLTAYKVISLAIGFALCKMGYKLFMSGVWGPKQGELASAGEVQAQFRDNRILIKKAAPGTFFVVLGTALLIFSMYKGLDLKYASNTQATQTHREPLIDQGRDINSPKIEKMPTSPPIR